MMKKFSTRFTKQSIHIFDTGVLSDDLFAELIQRDDDDGSEEDGRMSVRMCVQLGVMGR